MRRSARGEIARDAFARGARAAPAAASQPEIILDCPRGVQCRLDGDRAGQHSARACSMLSARPARLGFEEARNTPLAYAPAERFPPSSSRKEPQAPLGNRCLKRDPMRGFGAQLEAWFGAGSKARLEALCRAWFEALHAREERRKRPAGGAGDGVP